MIPLVLKVQSEIMGAWITQKVQSIKTVNLSNVVGACCSLEVVNLIDVIILGKLMPFKIALISENNEKISPRPPVKIEIVFWVLLGCAQTGAEVAVGVAPSVVGSVGN